MRFSSTTFANSASAKAWIQLLRGRPVEPATSPRTNQHKRSSGFCTRSGPWLLWPPPRPPTSNMTCMNACRINHLTKAKVQREILRPRPRAYDNCRCENNKKWTERNKQVKQRFSANKKKLPISLGVLVEGMVRTSCFFEFDFKHSKLLAASYYLKQEHISPGARKEML